MLFKFFGKFDIEAAARQYPLYFLIIERPYNSRWNSYDERVSGDFKTLLYHGMGPDHTEILNDRLIVQNGMHSNKDMVPDSGTVDHGAVSDRHIASDVNVRESRMDNTIILNIRIGPDSDSESISP
jgi:hypothetical protein